MSKGYTQIKYESSKLPNNETSSRVELALSMLITIEDLIDENQKSN